MMDGELGMGISWVFGWIILTIIVGLIVRGITVSKQSHSNNSDEHGALQILEKRYARGEITEEQFEHMKKELES